MTKSAKHKREVKAICSLARDHGYMFQKLSHKADRFTTQWKRNKKTGKMTLTPAVCIKLIVPCDSDLGAQVVALYKDADKRSKRAKR